MGTERKDRYRWACTGCGYEIERRPDDEVFEAMRAAHRQLVEAAAEHLMGCPGAGFEDVDGYYVADACFNPNVREVLQAISSG